MAGIEPGIPSSLRQQEATLTRTGLPDLNSHHPTGDKGPQAIQIHARWRQLRQPGLPAAPRSLASFLLNILLEIILYALAKFCFCMQELNKSMNANGILDEEEEREGWVEKP